MSTQKSLEWTDAPRARALPSVARAFGLNEEERELFLRVVADSLRIERHYELFLWLQSEMQALVPHEILISAWGDFARRRLGVDISSNLLGVRTGALARCDLDAFLAAAHKRWTDAGRLPVLLGAADIAANLNAGCGCTVHRALRSMRSLVVHGVRDQRGSTESLYIALHTGSLTRGRPLERFTSLVDALIAPIDIAFRKVGMLRPKAQRSGRRAKSEWLDLSIREQEILDLVCQGNTNVEVAAQLSISPYTVKNHVQRIFRKLGVTNRTEASAKYNQATREIARYL